jgi:hypothetical protein
MSSIEYSQEELDALKKEYAANATDEQFKLWIAECRTRNLAPVRDIIMQVRTTEEYDPEIKAKVKKKKSIYIVTIGAKRKIANATGLYAGQLPTKWIYLDANNHPTVESEIPLPDPSNPQLPLEPWAVRTSVLRKGFDVPMTVVSRFGAYCQTYKRDGNVYPTPIWSANGRMVEMLEKCSESAGLTRAFPDELAGLYINEELQKDEVLESIPVAAEAVVEKTEAPKPVSVPAVNHAPAQPTNEPRPNEPTPEKTRTKKEAKDTTLTEVILDKVDIVSGVAGDNLKIDKPASVVDVKIAQSQTVPSEGTKPAPDTTVRKMDKPANERARQLIKDGVHKENFKTYSLLEAGVAETKLISQEKWGTILDKLETLFASGGKDVVNEHLVQTPAPVAESDPF